MTTTASLKAANSLRDWLVASALPLWSTVGIDSAGGGFFEKIDLQGRPVEEPRRARVVARQIYVFATAARRGWLSGGAADDLVEHGLRFLLGKMRLADGTIAAGVQADGTVVRGGFDLYEHAFVLFALAAASADRPERSHLHAEAAAILACMRRGWSHRVAGFEEARSHSLPLKSNPHMHLLEAALAWAEVSSGASRAPWEALADEIVGLCLSRFIDSQGAVREYFDGDWQPMPGPLGRVVEPGHQFEWAWLLLRWAAARPESSAALRAGQRLLEMAEARGVDVTRGVAVNELDADFAVVDAAAKLWPQTERIKAWKAALGAGTVEQRAIGERALTEAIGGLSLYLLDLPRGLWHEQLGADGHFDLQDCRASSLYHIVCAIDVLEGPQGSGADPDGRRQTTAGETLVPGGRRT